MSDIISFRLNRDNPREAKALEILNSWSAEGYRVRHILTEALLKLNSPNHESVATNTTNDLNTTLDQVRKLLETLGNGNYQRKLEPDEESTSLTLADNFIASIRKVAKPGIKLD